MTSSAKYYQDIALAPSTLPTYSGAVRRYLSFTTMYNIPKLVSGLPIPSENIFVSFITHCAQRWNLTYSTIKGYLAAICHYYIRHTSCNPFFKPVWTTIVHFGTDSTWYMESSLHSQAGSTSHHSRYSTSDMPPVAARCLYTVYRQHAVGSLHYGLLCFPTLWGIHHRHREL